MLYFDKYQGYLCYFGGVTDSTGIVELELRFVGYGYVKTLQLNITAKNENNSFALAA